MVWGSLPSRVSRVAIQAGLRCARTGLRRSGGRHTMRGGGLFSTAAKVQFPEVNFSPVEEVGSSMLTDLPLFHVAHPLACQEPEGDDDGDGR